MQISVFSTRTFLCGVSSILLCGAASAGAITGSVKVRDTQGQLVPAAAQVRATSAGGQVYTTDTQAGGVYSFSGLPQGLYTVHADGSLLTGYTGDCDHTLELQGPQGSDSCLVILRP